MNRIDPWGECSKSQADLGQTCDKCKAYVKEQAEKLKQTPEKPKHVCKSWNRPKDGQVYSCSCTGWDTDNPFGYTEIVRNIGIGALKAVPLAVVAWVAPEAAVILGLVFTLDAILKGTFIPKTEEEFWQFAGGFILLQASWKISIKSTHGDSKIWPSAGKCAEIYAEGTKKFGKLEKELGKSSPGYNFFWFPEQVHIGGRNHGAIAFKYLRKEYIYDPSLGDNIGMIYGKNPIPRGKVIFTRKEYNEILEIINKTWLKPHQRYRPSVIPTVPYPASTGTSSPPCIESPRYKKTPDAGPTKGRLQR